mgnify:CR=1 FL=1
MKVASAKEEFLQFISVERALSANTIAAYSRDLQELLNFIGDIEVEEVSEEMISAFIVDLKVKKKSQSSSNRTVSTIRSFFKYHQRENGISNPVSDIHTPKIPKRLPKALSVGEITELISCSWNELDPLSLRSRAILELLYGTGARVSEVVGINLADIAEVSNEGEFVTVVKLRGKGSKERIVPLGTFAKKALDEYLVRTRPTLDKKGSKALFLNQKGGRLSRQSAWQIVFDVAQECGLASKVSPHVFRHSYATHLLDGGADIRVVQELLGHSSVTTTQIYTLITVDKVRESYMTAHPRSK